MKKIIPALALLLISAMVLATSSYAWFSMNATVSATGMSIKATNESGSLIIGAQTYTSGSKDTAPSLTSVQAANMTSVDLSLAAYNYTSDFSVKPCAHKTKTSLTDYDAVGNWFSKVADAPTSYASKGSETALTAFAGFVVYYDLYVTVAAGSPSMKNLKCNATIQSSGQTDNVTDPVRVLVASTSAAEEFYNAHTEGTDSVSAKTTGTEVLASTVTSSSLVHVRVYLYIDGEDASVYTNNANNLKSCTVSLSFVADEDTAS